MHEIHVVVGVLSPKLCIGKKSDREKWAGQLTRCAIISCVVFTAISIRMITISLESRLIYTLRIISEISPKD